MGVTIRQAAPGFGVSHQTIRNWIKHPLLHPFFSPSARRDGRREYAELFAGDLELCNSIQVLLAQNFDWKEIAEKLATGWRNKDLPVQLLLTVPADAVETTAYALIARASAEQKSTDLLEVIRDKDRRIAELENKLDRKDEEYHKQREADLQQLAQERIERAQTVTRLEVELELWRAGRLTPPKAEG